MNEDVAVADAERLALRHLAELVNSKLLTHEQEHEKASHPDEDTRQISDQTCHTCAGITQLWNALKAVQASPRAEADKDELAELRRRVRASASDLTRADETIRGQEAEIDFWVEESDRFRSRIVRMLRDRALGHATPSERRE